MGEAAGGTMRPIRVLFRSHEITETAFSSSLYFVKDTTGFQRLRRSLPLVRAKPKALQRHCIIFPLTREPQSRAFSAPEKLNVTGRAA